MELLTLLVFSVGGVICHQIPDRSFFWDGNQLPVCARCTGLYLSGFVGLVGFLAFRAARPRLDARVGLRVLLIAAVPTAGSVAFGALGWWDGDNVTRALLAIPLGATAGMIVAAVFTKDLR